MGAELLALSILSTANGIGLLIDLLSASAHLLPLLFDNILPWLLPLLLASKQSSVTFRVREGRRK